VAWHATDPSSLEWLERDPREGEEHGRLVGDLTAPLELQESRARLWRYPAHTTGRRHADKVQEEVFVVVSGTLTMLLGDPAERVDVGPGGVVAVQPGTALQVRNETDEELVLFIYGAPAEQGGADFFDDVPLPPKA
jgi:mannose-6-phosphate isomerase-like protein (cupin superfamily)